MNTGNDILTFPLSLGEGWGEAYRIGRIGKAHGVKGEVQMQVEDDVFDRVSTPYTTGGAGSGSYVILMIDGILVPFFMEEYRFKSDEIALVKFCDVDTQEQARELTGCDVYFRRDKADEQPHDLTYAELVGYEVIDAATNKSVGRIAFVDDATDNLLFELEDETLIPASEDLIEDVDQDNKRITINIPEGILDL